MFGQHFSAFSYGRRLAGALLGLLFTTVTPQLTQALDSLQVVDSAGNVGAFTALALDSQGFPVVSYFDNTNFDLKLVHCNDANCAGNNESIVAVDTAGDVGAYTSLVLDSQGFPVVSYYDSANGDLKLVHCNDANCAGNNESIVAVDTAGTVGAFTALALDSQGFPVVSYFDNTNFDLKLVHCNDANCAGNDESLQAVDTAGFVGFYTSLVLDSQGFPVVSYWDGTNDDLKLAHCNDANCAGNDESLQAVDTAGFVGLFTALVLDSQGFPVVSYFDDTNSDLKLVHCNDANCAGNDESLQAVDTAGNVGFYIALVLDSQGFPVVSYWDITNFDLKLVHCNDVNCAGNNESIVAVDTAGTVGAFTALALDSQGFPVVSYWDGTNGDLKLVHCDDANCAPPPPDPCTTAVPTSGCTVNGVPNLPCQGGSSDDFILGTSGNDVMRGGAGADTLKGNAGDDLLCGEEGDDTLLGAHGADTLLGGQGSDVLKGEAGNDTLDGGSEDDTLIGGMGTDALDGGPGNDKLLGNEDADVLLGDIGNDILNGGEANDVLDGEADTDTLTGGPGVDTCLNGETLTACE